MTYLARIARSFAALAAGSGMALALAAPAAAQDTFKLGLVTFLSGPAAESFGVPASKGAQFVIDQRCHNRARRVIGRIGDIDVGQQRCTNWRAVHLAVEKRHAGVGAGR